MRLATWNVNSARTRKQHIVDFLQHRDIDVLAVQETKCQDKQFPAELFEDLGYDVAHVGVNQWNGVALLSRVGLTDVQRSFPGQPRFHKDADAPQELEPRAIGALCGGVRVWSLYVPNGRSIFDRHYDYKLRWLYALRNHVRQELVTDPKQMMALVGDFNVARCDEDVWDREFFRGKTHVTPAERVALEDLMDAGQLRDIAGELTKNSWTYWDYQGFRFDRDEGMRIDYQLASPALAKVAVSAQVDKQARAAQKASDHAPVIVEYEVPKSPQGPESAKGAQTPQGSQGAKGTSAAAADSED